MIVHDKNGGVPVSTSYASKICARRYVQQKGRCIWCARVCWIGPQGTSLKRYAEGLGMTTTANGWKKNVRARRATAEHVKPKSAGGACSYLNIVMACHGCNSRRGDHAAMYSPTPCVVFNLPSNVKEGLKYACAKRLPPLPA